MTTFTSTSAPRDWKSAIKRGLMLRCPKCGEGAMFSSYLKVNDACPACGEDLHHQRADDAPPYVTMFLAGHIVVAAYLATEAVTETVPMWVQMVVWPLLAAALCLALLPPVKGALVAWQWALRMHGFSGMPERAVKGF